MANQIRIKRRAAGGGSGSPSSLLNAELAYNEGTNVLYYGFGDDGSGNATSVIAIAGNGNSVTLGTTQTITGDKTFSGAVDITGTLSLSGVAVSATAAEINKLSGATITTAELNHLAGVSSNIQAQLDANDGDIADILASLGIADGAVNLGTFTGSTIPDSSSVKAALQALETELEDGAGTLTADDSNTADFSGGTVTVAGGAGITTTATGSTLTATLDDTAVTAGSYGYAAMIPTFEVDAQGRITDVVELPVNIDHTQVSDFDASVQANTLDTMAAPVSAVGMNGQLLSGLADPVDPQDAATKAYCDALTNGLDVKASCRAATTANITLSNTQTVDGVSLVAGDRVLVKDQTSATENGIYKVVNGGAWTRSEDANNNPGAEVSSGMFTFTEEGTANADGGFVLQTTGAISLGSTSLSFVQFSGAGQIIAGAGITKTGNQLDVETAGAGRIVVNANNIDLADAGTAGTYTQVTTDQYGRVTAGSTPTTLAGYSIADAQPLDATLSALAGLTTSADQFIYSTGSDAFSVSSLSTYARSLLDDIDAAAARVTLGLGSIATQAANSVSITGGTINGVVLDGGTY